MTQASSKTPDTLFKCFSCGHSYPQQGFSYRCSNCGGFFDFDPPPKYSPPDPESSNLGIGRFRRSFPLDINAPFISLGEGGTPIVALSRNNRSVYLKCEHLNPTGSFKDRGMAVLVNALTARGVEKAVEDSSGNAGASFAAYAARAGIEATVYVPDYASGPKKDQIEAYGAGVVRVPGPRSAVSEAAQKEADRGSIYASHTHLPHGIAGMATIAYELVDQLGCSPGAVIMPVGQGSLFLGLYHGFMALIKAGVLENLPRLVGVQARVCAPIWAVSHYGAEGLERVQEGETIAEGIRILHPLRSKIILKALDETKGLMVAVTEEDIYIARDELARHGLYVEPTSAVVWAALEQCFSQLEDPVVLVLTGHGLKSPSIT